MRVRLYILLVAALVAGCASSGVKNPSGVPVTRMNADEQGFVAGTGVTRTVRPSHSNGWPVHACNIAATWASRILPRRAWSTPAISNSSTR